MNPRTRVALRVGILATVLVVLCLVFPPVLAFAERAGRELRYFWWLVLIVLLGVWLIWGARKQTKE